MIPILANPIAKKLFNESESNPKNDGSAGRFCLGCGCVLYMLKAEQYFWFNLWFKEELQQPENRVCVNCIKTKGEIKRCVVCHNNFYASQGRTCSEACLRSWYRNKLESEDESYLSDAFVISSLCRIGFNHHKITQKQITQKRAILKINRQIKKHKQNEKQQQANTSGNNGRIVNVLQRANKQ
jgi:hypothetical protein